MSLATMMTVVVVSVQLKRCRQRHQKSNGIVTGTLSKPVTAKFKEAHKMAVKSASRVSQLCCIRPENPVDESYCSKVTPPTPSFEMNTTSTVVAHSEDGNSEMVVPTPTSTSMALSTDSYGCEIVTVELATRQEEADCASVQVKQEEAECASEAPKKRKRKRRRTSLRRKKRHEPVMETEERHSGIAELCVERTSRSRPVPATSRSHYEKSAVIFGQELHPQPQMFMSDTFHEEIM